ncbi:disintegrin and metalloproteinase domain-containing protein 10-like isoform X1 [Haliotis rufescens]|uniref:disintegrin and metalloproteinase domain-containing protein 10-like isoform X1 n=2 Tax=Haliotis rufescens TaxID=6454 RepID=UPI00201EE5EC|nr:disintegrin and metalloproteinase domain-containing protein 10-like isoform X1 [Haliotis rufescens]
MRSFLVVFICSTVQLFGPSEQKSLTDYINHYEELRLDTVSIHRDHERVRRSLDSHLYLRFKAFNRDFHIKLEKDTSVYSPDHVTSGFDGRFHPVDTSYIYQGSLVGVPHSYVHLSIINGTTRGHVHIPGETTYHIEPAEQYMQNPHFHSVIYDERHVDLDPYRHRREADRATCGNDHHFEWMRRVAESAYESPNRAKRATMDHEEPLHSHNKYTEQLNRQKRAPKNLGTKNTCYLYLRSDPMLWNYVKNEKYPGTTLSDERAKEEILAFFASHVAALKSIYSTTTFNTYDDTMSYKGINFLVQRTRIMTSATEKCSSASASAWCNPNIDVSNFLNLNSMDNHDDFCLAYVFTYRDFIQGTLGLAWVGSETKAAGGICEQFKEYPEGNQRVGKSLNTGIVTIVNYGKPVQARVSQLTFAHEVGHNFGSPHDKGPTCAPYGTSQPDASQGNYIMFASATLGDKNHNDEFSTCSRDNITRVLDAVVNKRYSKINCFNSSKSAFCGNGITEAGEQCDCGYASDCDQTDECCFGKGSVGGPECTLRPNKDCSPTAGPCCNKDCTFQTGNLCKKKDDCSKDSKCDGTKALCPDPTKEPNNTFCNSFSQVCTIGECIGSVCSKISWEECFLTSAADGNGPSREELCFVSCRKTSTSTCVSSYNTAEINKPENKEFSDLLNEVKKLKNATSSSVTGIQLPAGSPCDNFRGYCDVFHRCRGVDADGPLARLKNLIFNPETLQSIKDWIVVNWWAVMLMGIGLVVVMGVFIKVCAVHTPSSNPRKPPARKLTLPRRHGNQGNKPQARSVPVHDPPPPYSSAAHGGPPPPGHGKNHHRHNNNKQGAKNSRPARYEMQPRAYAGVPCYDADQYYR